MQNKMNHNLWYHWYYIGKCFIHVIAFVNLTKILNTPQGRYQVACWQMLLYPALCGQCHLWTSRPQYIRKVAEQVGSCLVSVFIFFFGYSSWWTITYKPVLSWVSKLVFIAARSILKQYTSFKIEKYVL